MADFLETGDKKRLRVSRACDECRRRKDRCDGRQPLCRPCSSGKRTCTYTLSTKKRGLPTGYVRAIEILLGLVFRHVDGSEALVLTLLTAERDISDSNAVSIIAGRDPPKAESLLSVWRKSSVSKQIDLLLPLAESLEDDDAFPKDWMKKSLSESTNSQDKFQTPSSLPVSRVTELPPGHTPLSGMNGDTVHLPANWSQLLELYFSNTHSWFPICQKQDLLRPAYILANNDPDQTHQLAKGERAFLWAVFAYVSYQYEGVIPEDRVTHNILPMPYSSDELISTTKRLLFSHSKSDGIGSVRALLLLGLLEMGRGCWSASWVLVGQAVYISIDLGLISSKLPNSTGILISPADEGQNRASRGCFVLDTLISAYLGRRPYLKRSDLGPVGLLQTDGIEEWEAWQPYDKFNADTQNHPTSHRQTPGRTLSIFNKFVDLIALLNDLISEPDTKLADTILGVSQGLDLWKQQLPSHCQISSPTSDHQKVRESPQLLNICLAAFFVSSILEARAGKLLLARQNIMSGELAGLADTTFSVVMEHIQNFGSLWIPATFQAYLNVCNKIRTIRSQPLVMGNTDERERLCLLREKVERFWRGSKSSEQTGEQQPSGRELTFESIHLLRNPQAEVSNLPIAMPSTLNNEMDSLNFIGSLASGDGEDSLFNSLASLDPVDWTANQSDFMENLGFTGDLAQTDISSFFNI